MRLNILLPVIILAELFSACRTSAKREKGDFLDTEDAPVNYNPEASEDVPVPSFLWSPSRRRSTAGYYYLVAEYMQLDGDTKRSQPLFEVAYNLDPNPFLGSKLIAAQANTGDLDKALIEAKKMVLLYPKSAHLHFLYGQLLARQGLFGESAKQIEIAIQYDPNVEDFYLELANLYQRSKDLPKAIVITRELVKNIPSSINGWSRLARLYLATNQKKAALDPAQHAYDIQSSDPENVLILAIALELNGKSKEAIALYEQIYRLNPANEEIIARMIELYRSIGDLSESLTLLDEISKLPNGNKPGVQLQRAIILWELKRFEEAAAVLDKLAAEFPEHDKLRYMSGLGQEKTKHFDRALKTFSSIEESSQFYLFAQFRSAVILKQQNKNDESLKIIQNLITNADADWEIFGFGAGVYADLGKYNEAVDVLKIGISKFPDKVRLLFLKGVYQEKSGDIDGCIASMRAVIAMDPSDSSAYNYLGYLYVERNENLDEAEKLIRRALELKPADGYYLDSLGWLYYQKKDYVKALDFLQQALAQVPDEGVVLEHIGDVYQAMGKGDLARKNYEKALKTRLEKKDRERIEAKLKNGSASPKPASKDKKSH